MLIEIPQIPKGLIHLPSKPIKIGIIGCGHIAHSHLRAYEQIMQKEGDLFRITHVCDRDEEAAREMATHVAEWQDIRPMVHSDVHKMIAHYEVDGADICTPHYDHHITGVQCLEFGTNVLIEKPFGVTVRASRLIIEAARKNGLITACANNIRREAAQRAAYWAINERGMIGEPRMFFIQHAGYHRPSPPPPRLALAHRQDDGRRRDDHGPRRAFRRHDQLPVRRAE